MLKKIKVEEAVGLRLAHDITRIVPGKFKGAAFQKGHKVCKKDIPKLLDLGKKHIYVMSLKPGELHEDEAGMRVACSIAGEGIRFRGPREGKIEFVAEGPGVLMVNVRTLRKINAIGSIIVSTIHNGSVVRPKMAVAGTRAIPLVIQDSKIRKVEEICRREGPILKILPFRKKKVGILVTGSEIFENRINDRSAKIVERKVEAVGSRVIRKAVVPDEPAAIAEKIREMKSAGCQIIVTTGGLSVDPDDATLEGIQRSGAEVIFYGVPILPGSMFVWATIEGTTILGAPACVIHDPTTTLDLFLPRAVADISISREEIVAMGHGGFCLKCPVCRYPICPFGKGG
jgi:molybdenum cofactor synthesis domain-containing protein